MGFLYARTPGIPDCWDWRMGNWGFLCVRMGASGISEDWGVDRGVDISLPAVGDKALRSGITGDNAALCCTMLHKGRLHAATRSICNVYGGLRVVDFHPISP